MLRALLLGLGLLLLAPATQASVIVNFSFTLTPPGGTAEDYQGSFRLVGDASVEVPAGASAGSGYTWSHAVFGYALGAIQDFVLDPVAGTQFGKENINPRVLSPDYAAAAVWFDAVPAIGESPKMLLFLAQGSHQLGLGDVLCSGKDCSLATRAYAIVPGAIGPYTGAVATSVSAVPVPAALPLLAAALAGLGLAARRRRARA